MATTLKWTIKHSCLARKSKLKDRIAEIKNLLASTFTKILVKKMNQPAKNEDVMFEVPTANITVEALVPSITAISKDKKGNIKAKQHGDGQRSYSANFNGELIEESAEITNPEAKSATHQKDIEKQVVHRLLPVFNEDNSTNFLISMEIPKQNDIADVLIEDSHTKEKVAIQVTISDEKAIAELNKTKSLSRSGNAYQLSCEAIMTRIRAKATSKYPGALRRVTILALDGWHGVTKQILGRFKLQEKDFLEQSGYRQIWFVGDVAEDIIRLF